VAPENIKLNAEEVLGQVGKIAATMAEVSVPGPVPPPGPGGSPIDAALITVQLAAMQKSETSSSILEKRGTEHSAASQSAVAAMQAQEETNTSQITEIQSQVPQAGLTTL
jgi:hypothetical protein